MTSTLQTDPSARPSDAAGVIETRGIDRIPDEERHGRPSSLFWVWMSANVVYVYFVYGGILMLLGLGLWEAIAVTVAGNLWWIAIGFVAISGPASGTPSVTIMRAMFGIRGNRVFGAGLGVAIGLFFEILNLTFATLAAVAFLDVVGVPVPDGVEWIVLAVVTLASFGIGVFGHGTILRLSPLFTAALAVCFIVLAVFVLQAADPGYAPEPLGFSENWSAILLGFTIVASGPLSWGTSADYSRYLPATTSRRAVLGWTALGGFLPAVVIGVLGVLAGTAIDMTDPQIAIAKIVPAWFYPVFLFVIVFGSITNNVLTAYSTGLYVLALGVPISRAWSTVITGVIAGVAAGFLLFGAADFLDTLNYAIELAVAVLGPLVAVYVVDVIRRRNRYDGLALTDESRASPFWYRNGVFWPGVVTMIVAPTVAILTINTTLYTGPIAAALGGADLSALVGPALAAGLYALLWYAPRKGLA